MKKILFIVATMFAINLNAQTDLTKTEVVGFTKGDTFVTGSFKFNDNSETEQSRLDLYVSANKFVSDNLTLGVDLGIESTPKVKADNYIVGVQARRYFNASNQFSTFLQLGGDAKIDSTSYVDYKAYFGGGVNYFISKNFALEASLGAVSYNRDKAFNAGLDLTNVKLGLNYKF